MKWAHLPRHKIIGENTCPVWVFHPSCGWVNISSGEKINFDARYQYSELLFKRLVERSAAEEVFKKMKHMKKSWPGLQWGAVKQNIGKQAFSLQK